MNGSASRVRALAAWFAVAVASLSIAQAQEPLFEAIGPPDARSLPDHAVAGQAVRINPRALQSPVIALELFGETYTARRLSADHSTPGQTVWLGHLDGKPGDTVVLTRRGARFSGFIQLDLETYRITAGTGGGNRLLMLDLQTLPWDDAGGMPDGGGAATAPQSSEALADAVVQDLLVVFNQAACDAADPQNPGNDCAQLEADIVTAVADMNAAYAASGIDISMQLAGMAETTYTGTGASQALSHLAGTSDGQMDEVHTLRNTLGADIVSLVYRGEGCGIGYLSSSASSAFNVTDEPCLVGNRTMAHEIGHNQGAHHDRQTVGGGTSGAFNYGFRRCSDGSVDDHGAPYFRTVLAYPCNGSPRVGRFSNPNISYEGVPQGVDPAVDPARGAWNARTLNESAAYVASFRTAPSTTPPAAPSNLVATAAAADAIDLDWQDHAGDETRFVVQTSPDQSAWSGIATLGANATSFTHNDLLPETTHYYRVRAENGAGVSAWSNVAWATTLPVPGVIEDLADGQVAGQGTVSGSYLNTHARDGVVQTITETHSGGSPKNRRQAYAHAWTFDVFGGAGGVVVSVSAWVSGSEGANFHYSLDGGASRSPMFTVSNNGPAVPQTFTLPPGTSGPVRIEVTDASATSGEPVDSVSVDHLLITSYSEAGEPPATPSGLSVTGTTSNSVAIQFSDNSDNEFGFELWRATANPGGNCSAGAVVATLGASAGTGLVSHSDGTAAPATTYWYWAQSFNGAGDNGQCSNAASGTTGAAPAMVLTASGTKVKGVLSVNLSWTGSGSGSVDVFRDGALRATVPNSGAWTDNTGLKGGGTLSYQVCLAGSSTCSNTQVVNY